MLPSENIVLQGALKAFRANKSAPAGYKIRWNSGVGTENWFDTSGKNPRPVKVFSAPSYDILGSDESILFQIGVYHGSDNRINYHVMFEADGENVSSWDQAMILGFQKTVLAEFSGVSKKTSMADLVDSVRQNASRSAVPGVGR